jgi:ATP-dependent Clp protease, protease subunit
MYDTTKENDDVRNSETRPYWFFEQNLTRRILHFYFSEVVEEPNLYVEMIHHIRTAGPDCTIYIHLNTPGGRIDTGVQLINAMQTSEAHIICSLEGRVASLGTMIFLAADEFIVHDNCIMMFHNYSGGVFGKGHEQIAALEATNIWIENIMRNLYIPFMSDEEFNRIVKGEDLYFQAEEIRKRLHKMVKTMEKQIKEEQKAAKTPTKPKSSPKKQATKGVE